MRQIMYREQVSWWRRRAGRPVTMVARVPDAPAQDQMVMVEARLALRDALLAVPPGKRAVRQVAEAQSTIMPQQAEPFGRNQHIPPRRNPIAAPPGRMRFSASTAFGAGAADRGAAPGRDG